MLNKRRVGNVFFFFLLLTSQRSGVAQNNVVLSEVEAARGAVAPSSPARFVFPNVTVER